MGRLPSENRKYQLQALNSLHHEILRYDLLGYRAREIADALGVTEPTVCNVLNGAKGRFQKSILRGARDAQTVDVARDILEYAPIAWKNYTEALEDPNLTPALKLKYNLEAIGLAGHVKPQRVQVQGSVTHLTGDELLAIKQRARQLALESGVIDVEYREGDQGGQPSGDSTDLDKCETQSAGPESSDCHVEAN